MSNHSFQLFDFSNWFLLFKIFQIFYDVLETFNTCVHFFSIKSCVQICHARDKNRKIITVRFKGLKKLHEYILNGLNSQLNNRTTSLPANFRFYRMLKILFSKIFIAPKDSPWNFRGTLGGCFQATTPSSGWNPQFWAFCHARDRFGRNC